MFARLISIGALSALILLSPSCLNRASKQSLSSDTLSVEELLVRLPEPPAHLASAHEQARYMVDHFWDNINLSDPSIITHAEAYEEAIVTYLGLLTSLPLEEVRPQLLYPLEQMVKQPLLYTMTLYRKYLYEADSPLTNEDFFRPVLEWAISSPRVDQPYQEQASLMLKLINKNRVGQQAEDFLYKTADERSLRLSQIKSPYTMVIFSSIGCPYCREVMSYLKEQKGLAQMAARGQLTLLVIYLGEGASSYIEQRGIAPEWATVGYDPEGEIMRRPLYDLKASPTCYLLGRSREVVMKDAMPDEIVRYLQMHE